MFRTLVTRPRSPNVPGRKVPFPQHSASRVTVVPPLSPKGRTHPGPSPLESPLFSIAGPL